MTIKEYNGSSYIHFPSQMFFNLETKRLKCNNVLSSSMKSTDLSQCNIDVTPGFPSFESRHIQQLKIYKTITASNTDG